MSRTHWYTQGRLRQTAVSSFGVKWDSRRKRRVTRDACISSLAWLVYFTRSLIFGRNKRLLAVKGGIWRHDFYHVIPRAFSRGFGLVILCSQTVFDFLWLYLCRCWSWPVKQQQRWRAGANTGIFNGSGKIAFVKAVASGRTITSLASVKGCGRSPSHTIHAGTILFLPTALYLHRGPCFVDS